MGAQPCPGANLLQIASRLSFCFSRLLFFTFVFLPGAHRQVLTIRTLTYASFCKKTIADSLIRWVPHGNWPPRIGPKQIKPCNTQDKRNLRIGRRAGNIPESFGNLPAKCTDLRLSGNKMSGVVPAAVKSHANWATGTKKWNPATNILPQQEGFGLTE